MPRHILTPEERLKGGKTARAKLAASGKAHKLTSADSRKGALAVHAYARTIGVHHGHALTLEDRRRGGLATAAKRKSRRLMDLLRKAGDAGVNADAPEGIERHYTNPGIQVALPAQRGSESPLGDPKDWVDVIPVADLPALGASLAGKLFVGGSIDAPPMVIDAPTIDPFTLSALKRFLPGPRSPLSLTRSQRAHVDIMRKAGYLTVTGDSMLALTEKGRRAVQEAEDTGPDGEASDLHYPNGGGY